MGLCLSLFLFFPKICTPHPVPPQKRNAYLIAYLGGKKERKKKKGISEDTTGENLPYRTHLGYLKPPEISWGFMV